MQSEARNVCRDEATGVEACRFQGVVQPFPNHFHRYYVIGYIEAGGRRLSCNGRQREISQGDLLIFNPGDGHGCVQSGGALCYRRLNIPKNTMLTLAERITGEKFLPVFSQNVVRDRQAARLLCRLHRQIEADRRREDREKSLLSLAALLIEKYGQNPVCREKTGVEEACKFIEENFPRRITLDMLCRRCGLSKSALLRRFTRHKGVTPYRYLQAVRVDRAKTLLRRGETPAQAAADVGFSDQSHFSKFFKMLIGLSPAAYRRIFRETGKNLRKEDKK